MNYTWLKEFNVELGKIFPCLGITLKIINHWDAEIPFYTFLVSPSLLDLNLGRYLYTGKYIDTMIKPEKELLIKANLHIVDIYANDIRKKIFDLASKEKTVKVTLNAQIDLLNYSYGLPLTTKEFSLEKALEWIQRSGECKSDFIPVPSHNTSISILYSKLNNLQKLLSESFENRLKGIESNIKPIIALFEKGLQEFCKSIEEGVESRYATFKPIIELIELLSSVSKNLDQNWALSALALSALENIINLKLVKLGEETKGDFSDRVERLRRALIKKENWKEEEASGLARKLREKYTGRGIVLHASYDQPVSENLAREDVKFLKEVISRLQT